MMPYENDKWRYELYTSLANISIRKNNKKLKFWYDAAQLEQIKSLVRSASNNAELKLEKKGERIVSFTVIDTSRGHKVFEGIFM